MNRCPSYNFGAEFKSFSSFSYYKFITEFQRYFKKDHKRLKILIFWKNGMTFVLIATYDPFWIFEFCIPCNKSFHCHCFFTICTDSPKFDLSIICHPPPIKILYSPAGPVPCFMYEVWTPQHYKISYFSHNASYLSIIKRFIFPFSTNANYETKRVKNAHFFSSISEWEGRVTKYFWEKLRIQKWTIDLMLNLKQLYLFCFFRFTSEYKTCQHLAGLTPFSRLLFQA